MMRVLVLAAILGLASAMPIAPAKPSGTISAHLRGVSAPADTKKEEEKPLLNPTKTDDRGPRGHFYYATRCEDCYYKGAQCGCQPAMEYFACLTKHCYKSNVSLFAESCTALGDKCATDININCRGSDTICTSKLNQLPEGGLGFSVDIDEDDAFCGPNGRCLGSIKLKAHLHNLPKPKPEPKKVAVAAAPAPAAAPAKDEDLVEEEPIWLECGLPKAVGASIDHKKDWIICQEEVEGDHGECKMPMFDHLEAGSNRNAYCVLTEGKGGKRLTQPHYSQIINVHKEPSKAVEPEEAKEKEEPKEEPKEAKVLGDTHKAEKPKAEKPVAKKEEKEPVVMGDVHKLPWMVEKEKRAAARNTAEAKAAAAEKAAKEKAEKEAAAKKAAKEGVKSDSSLPWMQNKLNDKPPPPHEQVLGPAKKE